MPVLDEGWAGAGGGGGVFDDSKRQRCSCLPFCFWGASSSKPAGAPAKRKRRRRLRLRLSWLAWPWFFRKGGGKRKGAGGDGNESKGRKRRGRRLLLLLTASLQPKKALASVVSGGSALLPAKVSSFGDAKKQSNRKPRPAADDGPSGSRHPQASTSAAATRTRWTSTAPAPPRPETSQSGPRPTDGPAVVAGRTWRAPSRRHSFRHQSERTGLWTAATTLGVIVLFGRVTAVVFLCSCLYGARFVRARLGGAGASAKATSSGVAGGGCGSRRFGDPAGVAGEKVVVKAEPCATEVCKKKVVMVGLLERPGKTASSRFGR
ncbi:hypothetical protein SEVIR_9G214100v4 [Setaria viridis]|uniref:Uncharacterized protein n=1 Tax=Setaria viridis TaxID=4556 RepID=A0A4U6SYP2_SETVI|nr:uncharacterized protein LOC117836992 [Setaria viridis]TKV93253.1 hypothetical protein SEVIR_9G214100v2 [Setaria viridis]